MNLIDGLDAVSLSLKNSWDGAAQPAPPDKTMGPNGAANFVGDTWTGLDTAPTSAGGSGWVGSGVIVCDEDCIVLVSDESRGVTVDRANYIGIPN